MTEINLPEHLRYVAIEGVIGVGKTTLAKYLAKRFGGHAVLEMFDENPFLESFYANRERWAFHTQLSFLASRFKQQKGIQNRDLFRTFVVSDYTFDKDRIFAHLNLVGHELSLYNSLFSIMEPTIPRPDLIVYLQSNTDRLMRNIALRGRAYERKMKRDYIQSLVEAYDYFFFRYIGSPLLIVNAAELDFVKYPDDLDEIVRQICTGRHTATTYFNFKAPSDRSEGGQPELDLK
ncbi:MAG: deoxynucleoside kinase [Rhodothermia bacterium]